MLAPFGAQQHREQGARRAVQLQQPPLIRRHRLGHKPPVVGSTNILSTCKRDSGRLSCGTDNATFEEFGNECLVSLVGKVSGGPVDGHANGVHVIVRDTSIRSTV